MAKLSGLIGDGKIGKPDQNILDAMPAAPSAAPVASSSRQPAVGPEHTLETPATTPQPGAGGGPIVASLAGHPLPNGKDLRTIPVELIDLNPHAPRTIYTPQMVEARARDLRVQGQHDAIHVIPNPDNPERFIIADGWTRVRACREHKVMDALLAEVHHGLSVGEAAWFGYHQNEGRQQQYAFDRAMFFENWLLSGVTASEIERRTGVSDSEISRLRAFAKLPDELRDLVVEYPDRFGSSAAEQLFRAYDTAGHRKLMALARQYIQEQRSYRWLAGQVDALVHPTPRKPAQPVKKTEYANGYLRQRQDAFEVSIRVTDIAKRELFAQQLEDLLATVAEEPPPAAEDGK